MQNIKIIIGASYGDEGKGLATDFFGAQEQHRQKQDHLVKESAVKFFSLQNTLCAVPSVWFHHLTVWQPLLP